MSEGLGWDETVVALRRSLIEATGNARAFAVRSRGRPALVSARTWAELSDIEACLAFLLQDALRRELRVEAWKGYGQMRALLRGIVGGLAGERRFVAARLREARAHPVERWRAGTPQLEAALWPFFTSRTHYLANTLSLALDEPAPYPPLAWIPARREFVARPER